MYHDCKYSKIQVKTQVISTKHITSSMNLSQNIPIRILFNITEFFYRLIMIYWLIMNLYIIQLKKINVYQDLKHSFFSAK